MYACGKGKDEYLTDESPYTAFFNGFFLSFAYQKKKKVSIPKKSIPKYWTWKIENYMVKPWLINSMTIKVGENFFFTRQPKRLEMQHMRCILVQRIHQNYSKFKPDFMICVKEILMSIKTSIFLQGIGSILTCLSFTPGNAMMTQPSTIKLLNKRELSSFLLISIKT